MPEIVLGTVLLTALILVLTIVVMGARAIFLPARPVTITVNRTTEVHGTTGEKLLNTLNGAGIAIPSACGGAGTCGLCKVRVVEGAGDPLPTELARFSRAEIAEGTRLACQVVVRNALAVAVPDEILSAEDFKCKVVRTTMLAPLIREIVLKPADGREFTFRAGSFMQVIAPPYSLSFVDFDVADSCAPVWDKLGWRNLESKSGEEVTRAYSIASTPHDDGNIVLNIRLAVPPPHAGGNIPPGIVSSYLFSLKEGDAVTVSGPFGEFHAQESEREMVLLGGGVGMAPLRAIIYDQLERLGSKRKISFWYGARSTADIFYRQEFDALAKRHENFSWTVALSDPGAGTEWDGPTGFIHDVALNEYLKDHPAPEDCEYYLCGPPLMIRAVLGMLEDIGVEDEMIYNDDFGS